MARCRACGADIEFVRTAKNDKAMPLDTAPSPDGNVAIIDGRANVLGPLELAVLDDVHRAALRMPHHATCPNWNR